MRIHNLIAYHWNRMESATKAFLICVGIYALIYIVVGITEEVIWWALGI